MTAGEQKNNEAENKDSRKPREDSRGEAGRDSSTGEIHARSAGEMGERDRYEKPKTAAMEVAVENNIEKAMKVLKRKLIKEGLFKELKSRRYYEKPSERKKRKHKESLKKIRKEEMRQKRNSMLFS